MRNPLCRLRTCSHRLGDRPTSLLPRAGQTLPQTDIWITDLLTQVQPQEDGRGTVSPHEIFDFRSEALVIVLPDHLGKLFRVSHHCGSRETLDMAGRCEKACLSNPSVGRTRKAWQRPGRGSDNSKNEKTQFQLFIEQLSVFPSIDLEKRKNLGMGTTRTQSIVQYHFRVRRQAHGEAPKRSLDRHDGVRFADDKTS